MGRRTISDQFAAVSFSFLFAVFSGTLHRLACEQEDVGKWTCGFG